MWTYCEDRTEPVITAKAQIESQHRGQALVLPKTALLFYMRGGIEFINQNYPTELITEKFPRFLNVCPLYRVAERNGLCFLDGGRGAPQAVDTLETLAALGVENVISVGMFGAFAEQVESGAVLVPGKAFVEEGTSLHYYPEIAFSRPDEGLRRFMAGRLGARSCPIVSTDAPYRQTFYKERLWREKGAAGVDMETSALFSVGHCLGIKVAAVLIASDKHPVSPQAPKWQWHMTKELREAFFAKCVEAALEIEK